MLWIARDVRMIYLLLLKGLPDCFKKLCLTQDIGISSIISNLGLLIWQKHWFFPNIALFYISSFPPLSSLPQSLSQFAIILKSSTSPARLPECSEELASGKGHYRQDRQDHAQRQYGRHDFVQFFHTLFSSRTIRKAVCGCFYFKTSNRPLVFRLCAGAQTYYVSQETPLDYTFCVL